MRAELTNLNHHAIPFLSRAAVNLSWYDSRVLGMHIFWKSKPCKLLIKHELIMGAD